MPDEPSITPAEYKMLIRYLGKLEELSPLLDRTEFCLSRRTNGHERITREALLSLLYLVSRKFAYTGMRPPVPRRLGKWLLVSGGMPAPEPVEPAPAEEEWM